MIKKINIELLKPHVYLNFEKDIIIFLGMCKYDICAKVHSVVV